MSKAGRGGRGAAACAALLLFGIAFARPSPAQTIKIGSLAPTGSPWDDMLKRIAADWTRASDGRVRLVIYPGGIVGDEPDMIRKMRIGQLQGAAMTAVGIGRIHPPVLSVGFPLLVRSDRELDLLMDRMSPALDKGIADKGYQVVAWSASGWIYFFSRRPIARPDDLRGQKLWMWEGNPDELAAWTSLGFRVVPLKATDVLIALQGGMIDALCVSPIAAAVCQWFALAPNMLALRWIPLYGGLVVTKSAWDRIPAEMRPALLESARATAREMNAANREGERRAMEAMCARGLTVTQPSPADLVLWEELARGAADRLVGSMFDTESYEKAAVELQAIRR
jgi:TRAP-type C4-dicarboxylate transport system substrate-binding protein